jgi:hypothetical protein
MPGKLEFYTDVVEETVKKLKPQQEPGQPLDIDSLRNFLDYENVGIDKEIEIENISIELLNEQSKESTIPAPSTSSEYVTEEITKRSRSISSIASHYLPTAFGTGLVLLAVLLVAPSLFGIPKQQFSSDSNSQFLGGLTAIFGLEILRKVANRD